jgi:SAM-dependent methyltransferase
MTESLTESSTVAHDWDAYWRGSSDGMAFASEGVGHPLVLQFWHDFFAQTRHSRPGAAFLDFASGNGAIVDAAVQAFGNELPSFTCIDTSKSAIEMLKIRYPGVEGLVADALSVPLPSATFDIATSQFGVEYAGVEAVNEMARLIVPGGQIVLLMHIKDGAIFEECTANLRAVQKMQEIGFIAAAIEMFDEAHTCLRGDSPDNSRENYDAAAQRMLPIYREMDSIMNEYGEHVAGDTVVQLYREVDRINGRLMHHDPVEVIEWLKNTNSELDAYNGRMSSMCEAALDKATFDELKQGLEEQGFTIEQSGPLGQSESQLPLAWSLIATKPQ